MRFAFADCVLDSDSREILRAGRSVPLPPKAYALVELLIRQRPRALSKEEIHRHLWRDTHVADASLANLIARLRSALGDSARRPAFIRTVPRFGYAFVGDVEERPSPDAAPQGVPVFKLIWGDREFALREGENILGREQDAAAWIDVHSVSRRHARIVVTGDTATIEDLGSKNGTFLREEAVTQPRALRDGDRLKIGTVPMTVRRYVGGVSTESVRSL